MSLVDDLVPHMRHVLCAERDLRDLGLLWQMIEATSAIACPDEAEAVLPMLTRTRARFASLQSRLVRQLGSESLAALDDELSSSAQCTIDILVRNLYERTADVGFLATDAVLRAFCAAAARGPADPAAVLRRLGEYRAKYSVYDDVVLLAPDGRVLLRLEEGSATSLAAEPLVADALAGRGFVERFGPSALAAGAADVLLYAHRIDGEGGRCVGVLVLRFRLADEMRRVFDSVLQTGRHVALVLLDAQDRVIASADEAHIPLGARLQAAAAGEVGLTAFGGREYLSVTRAGAGFQGYPGPGWRAHAMVSLLSAFSGRDDGPADAALAPDTAELARLRAELDAINADLRRVVWNGRLAAGAQQQASARLKALLGQVQEAGRRTRDRVDEAIGELQRSALGRLRHQAQDMARLAADIMDRSLYERANDCRWWALSPVLERVLAAPPAAAAEAELGAVLAHVNSLYTVYTRLVAFRVDGTVCALSHEGEGEPLVGSRVEAGLLNTTLALADSQRYAVTPFAGSALSAGVPTYVYSAAVRDGQRRVVGGVAAVFDAARELQAMLRDVLGERAGIAAFVDAEGRVLASTDAELAAGSTLPAALAPGLAEYRGSTWAVSAVRADGYREFKRGDGYDNRVRALVALRLGESERRATCLQDIAVQALPPAQRDATCSYALFTTGAGRFGLPVAAVVEARPRDGLVRARLGTPHALGLTEVPAGNGAIVIPVLCARSLFGVAYPPRAADGVLLVLTLPGRNGRPLVGLWVDEVLCVVDSGTEHLRPVPEGLRAHSPLLAGLLRLQAGADTEVLAQILDANSVWALAAMAGTAPAMTPAGAAATASTPAHAG
ncbi:chemotaxis protein CheW [Rubrivivax gelatinosus]|nr:chemotaxis protein CheW [Rubrivivax gelatinosus]